MKIEIELDEQFIAEVRNHVVNRVADKVFDEIWNVSYEAEGSWEKRKVLEARKRQEILAKIDWKNAGSQLSENVVQKFFMKLLDK